MTRPSIIYKLGLVGVLLVLAGGPHGCRCGEDPQVPEGAQSGVAGLPDAYPTEASVAAEALAGYLPRETDAALFVASYASLVALTDTVKAWGLVDAQEMEGIFASLERYHGINPGKAQSYVDNGLALSGPLVIGRLDGSWFVLSAVSDRERFETFLDGVINEEFGRPRPQSSEHNGVAMQEIRVLKRDLMTVAWREDVVLIAAGERLIEETAPSADVMRRLLDTTPETSLRGSQAFEKMIARLGGEGPILFYTSEGKLALEALAPLTAASEALEQKLIGLLGEDLEAFGLATSVREERLVIESFAALPPEALADTLELVTAPGDAARLGSLVGPEARGVARLTFAPKVAEAAVLSLLEPKAAERWKALKGQLQVPFVVNFEQEVLYNLSGQLLVTLYEVDEEALVPADDLLAVLREGARGALYLPLADKRMANGFFGKVNALKDLLTGMLPKGQISFGEREGVMVVTIHGRTAAQAPVLHVLYHDGVLAASTGDEASLERTAARLKGGGAAGLSPAHAPILAEGPVWGLSLDMREIVQLLSARYDAVETQINRFLAPLSRVALRAGFEADGVGLQATIEMRAADGAAVRPTAQAEPRPATTP